MTDPTRQPDAPDPAASPADDHGDVPVPRLGTPAREPAAVSQEAERDAVGDAPDTGGLTPPDDAQ
ncbi:MAG: hypothetical protein AVDCRST_MAG48-3308 [uncultured Friedmanniella sp.]|uniref:Uncharacterized protein n=1 Tax=uncultured Friedmanniella sp. TaxID=335381 RepID=A0A6J4LIY5_9ACTN|nr:MAG: hypothetical protein AVDCRST_MAG48-3308 [uncultured Friedmanniella sp.]